MAKKDLASLMNGIMGNSRQDTQNVQGISSEPPFSEVTDEMKENLEIKRRQNVGRPRRGESAKKTDEIRATFIVDPEIVRKLKYVSLVEGSLLKDIIGSALTSYLDNWEAENGKIRLPKKKQTAIPK